MLDLSHVTTDCCFLLVKSSSFFRSLLIPRSKLHVAFPSNIALISLADVKHGVVLHVLATHAQEMVIRVGRRLPCGRWSIISYHLLIPDLFSSFSSVTVSYVSAHRLVLSVPVI